MKQILFIIFVVSQLVISCKKNTTIKVHVENIATGEPYVNHRVFIIEQPPFSLFGGGDGNETVYEGYTNEEGNLLIDLKYKENGKYSIWSNPPNDYCYAEAISYPLFQQETNDIHFKFAPCAQLKLKIENVNCQGGDKMVLYREHASLEDHYNDDGWQHDGCANWETNGYSSVPMGEIRYKWEVTRGATQTYYDTIYLEAGEKRVYEINY